MGPDDGLSSGRAVGGELGLAGRADGGGTGGARPAFELRAVGALPCPTRREGVGGAVLAGAAACARVVPTLLLPPALRFFSAHLVGAFLLAFLVAALSFLFAGALATFTVPTSLDAFAVLEGAFALCSGL